MLLAVRAVPSSASEAVIINGQTLKIRTLNSERKSRTFRMKVFIARSI